MQPARVVLLANRKSGTGLPRGPEDLLAALRRGLGPDGPEASLVAVATHGEAREAARREVERGGPVGLVAGGGGGTLRAVVEGACGAGGATPARMPGPEVVRIAPLRLGSGNLAARALGVPDDALRALEAAGRGMALGRVVPWWLVEAVAGRGDGEPARLLCVSMGGLGEFGRIPIDIERGPRAWPRARRAVAGLVGLERWNQAEYYGAVAARGALGCLLPSRCDLVRIRHDGRLLEGRLLAGVLLRQRVPGMPLAPPSSPHEPVATLHVLLAPRHAGLAARQMLRTGLPAEDVALGLAPGRDAEVELVTPRRADFFLDEDPEWFEGALRLRVAGAVSFVPSEGGEA